MAQRRPSSDLVEQLALERALFLIGEEAAHLSVATRRRIDQPWRDIIGLRNFLAHQYPDIDVDRLIHVAQQQVPPLVAAVRLDLSRR